MPNELSIKGNSNDIILKPLISIITVVLNGELLIENTILSVLNQTYDNVEYIIIDGGSIDKTIAIIQKYEKYIDYWISEGDDGIYDAMNKGINLATGGWINFMNSGDSFYDKHVLSKTFKQKYSPNVKVVSGDTVFIKGNKFIKSISKKVSKKNPMPFCHQSVFVDTQLMKNLKFDTNYKIMADRMFFFQLYFEKNIKFLCLNEIISIVQYYGYSNISIVKARKELNSILKKYGLISIFMAELYLAYAYIKDILNFLIKKLKRR